MGIHTAHIMYKISFTNFKVVKLDNKVTVV